VAQGKLNLFERRLGVVIDAGARAADVVWSEVRVAHLGGVVPDDLSDANSSSPVPHTLPFLRMARKMWPLEILAAWDHPSMPSLRMPQGDQGTFGFFRTGLPFCSKGKAPADVARAVRHRCRAPLSRPPRNAGHKHHCGLSERLRVVSAPSSGSRHQRVPRFLGKRDRNPPVCLVGRWNA